MEGGSVSAMRMLMVVVAVAISGCGPAEGSACPSNGAQQCAGASVSFCEGGKWTDYACPSGCDATKEQKCDWKAASVGAPCPLSKYGVGVCTADGEMTQCDRAASGNAWVHTACAACRAGQPLTNCTNGVCSCN